MNTLLKTIYFLLPFIALILVFLGIKQKRSMSVLAALWLSLISLVLHYQASGGELLGSYFNYINAAIYSINIIVMLISLLYLLSLPDIKNKVVNALNQLLKAGLIIGCFIIMANLWINAYFIETRMPGTPIMQVATFNQSKNCKHATIFYKISQQGTIQYLCPNQYGLLPGVGELSILPDFLARHIPQPILEMILKQKKSEHTKNDD